MAQGFALAQRLLADALALDVVPDKLVRIQLGGVAGEKVQLQASFPGLHIAEDGLSDVRGMLPEPETPGACGRARNAELSSGLVFLRS